MVAVEGSPQSRAESDHPAGRGGSNYHGWMRPECPDRVANSREMWGHWMAAQRDPVQRRQFALARRGLHLPATLHSRPPRHGLWAVTMVKNELDILEETVQHLLSQGVDRVLIADNLSTDGTTELIRRMALADDRIVEARDVEVGYYQAAKMTLLGRFAGLHGARWVIPFDADEFWLSPAGTLRDYFEDAIVGTHRAEIYNAFPVAGADRQARLRLDLEAAAMVKVAYAYHPAAILGVGNHWVTRAGGFRQDLRIVHVPWRSYDQFAQKLRQGAVALAATDLGEHMGPHWRRLGIADDPVLRERWEGVLAGRPDPELNWAPSGGRYRECAPTTWTTWPADLLDDPQGRS